MQLNQEQLDTVEELAGLFYTPHQIATILQVPVMAFELEMENTQSVLYITYNTGYFTADVALRKSVKKVALMGNSPAQTLLQKLIDQNKMNRI